MQNYFLQPVFIIFTRGAINFDHDYIVLKYINNETKRFRTFVANRISFVRDATDVSQWRYVSTKENSADEASSELTANRFLSCKRWTKGPEFLCQPDKEWRTRVSLSTRQRMAETLFRNCNLYQWSGSQARNHKQPHCERSVKPHQLSDKLFLFMEKSDDSCSLAT